VARTYVDIRQYQQQLAIATSLVAAQEATLKVARERFRSGTVPQLDITQAKAQSVQTQAKIPYYRNLLAQAEYSMDVLLGENPGATQAVITATQPVPAPDKALVLATPVSVIAQRPDVRAAERKLAAATAQQDVATAQFFPDISLSGFLGLLTTNSAPLLSAASKSWSIGGNLAWPILNYNTLSANLHIANAQQQEALLQYQKSVTAALSDVERSVTAYARQTDQRDLLEKMAGENKRAVAIARKRYKDGVSAFLEVLDAERTLYASQSDLEQSEALASQDLIAVYKSLGGGWKVTAASPAKP
jgi:NodT family efflux transporter outer membrane factor (OMF) lipoprotein